VKTAAIAATTNRLPHCGGCLGNAPELGDSGPGSLTMDITISNNSYLQGTSSVFCTFPSSECSQLTNVTIPDIFTTPSSACTSVESGRASSACSSHLSRGC